MGTVVKTINAAGDYTTLQAWENALPANLVTDGNIQQGKCGKELFSVAGGPLTIAGQTTDASNYIELTTDTGASFADDANKLTNQLRYIGSSIGAAITSSNNSINTITVSVNYTRVNKLQIQATGLIAICLNAVASHLQIVGNICQNLAGLTDGGIATNGDNNAIENNLCIIQAGTAISMRSNPGASRALNNTCVVPSNFSAGGSGILTLYGTMTITNNALFNFSTGNNINNIASASTITASFNSSDGTLIGTNNQASKTYANQFEQPSNAGGVMDFRAKTGADLLNNGTDLSGATPAITADIVGTSRPQGAAYDIGVWELVAGGGGGGGGGPIIGSSPLIRSPLMRSRLVG